jgi:hypothetical protein
MSFKCRAEQEFAGAGSRIQKTGSRSRADARSYAACDTCPPGNPGVAKIRVSEPADRNPIDTLNDALVLATTIEERLRKELNLRFVGATRSQKAINCVT